MFYIGDGQSEEEDKDVITELLFASLSFQKQLCGPFPFTSFLNSFCKDLIEIYVAFLIFLLST